MRQYDLSVSFSRFLLNHLKTAAGSVLVLAVLLVGLRHQYGIDWMLLASIFIGFCILAVVFDKMKHKGDLRDSHFEIHDDVIKWRRSGIEDVFNIGSIRDAKFNSVMGVENFRLSFGDGSEIEMDSSYPHFREIRRDLSIRVRSDPHLHFLHSKIPEVEA